MTKVQSWRRQSSETGFRNCEQRQSMGKKKNKVRKQTKSDIGGNICRLVRTKRLTGVAKS